MAEPPLSEPLAPPPATKPVVCIEQIERDSDRSVLEEQRGKAGAKRWDDFAEQYRAEYLVPETFHPVEQVESMEIGGTPLLWFTPDYAEAVVNAAVSTDLKVIDVPTLSVGQRVEIGRLTDLGFGRIGGRELARFLIEADVLQTYWHIGSTICLVSESKRAGIYHAQFTAEHVFFTNEENVEAFGFSVAFDEEGGLSVLRTEPVPFRKKP